MTQAREFQIERITSDRTGCVHSHPVRYLTREAAHDTGAVSKGIE